VVKRQKLHLLRIESFGADKQFKDVMGHLLAHLAGEVFAAGVAHSVGASPEASIFIAGTFWCHRGYDQGSDKRRRAGMNKR
jgi:hypothetical protein